MAAANKQEEQPSSSNAASSWKVNEWLHNNTYANVTKTAQPISKQNPTDKNQRKLNTFTFFNLMTSEDITERILKDLESHFMKKASTLVAKILRDTRFRSRYQVTFYNEDDVERLINNGITINGIRVRGNIERYANPVKPIRFYIPNLPSFLNEDEVQELIGDDNTSYVKQKQNRKFGVPVGGFYVGIYNSSREDRFIKFEGEDYKMVCLDKTRNVASHNATPSEVPPEVPNTIAPPEVPNIIAPPKEPNTKSPAAPIGKITPKEPNKTAPPEEPATKRKTPKPLKTKKPPHDEPANEGATAMDFTIDPPREFTFGEIQDGDPLALTAKEKRTLKKLENKEKLTTKELETKIELTNRSYCSTPPDSDSTGSGDTIKTTTSTMSTKRKLNKKQKQKKKKK